MRHFTKNIAHCGIESEAEMQFKSFKKNSPRGIYFCLYSIPDIYSQDPLANCPIGLHVPCNIFSSVD